MEIYSNAKCQDNYTKLYDLIFTFNLIKINLKTYDSVETKIFFFVFVENYMFSLNLIFIKYLSTLCPPKYNRKKRETEKI